MESVLLHAYSLDDLSDYVLEVVPLAELAPFLLCICSSPLQSAVRSGGVALLVAPPPFVLRNTDATAQFLGLGPAILA